MLLKDNDYIEEKNFQSIVSDCIEFKKLLISIINSTKQG